MMVNVQQPMRQAWHMDIKHFAILDGVEHNLLILQTISTHDNCVDALTKPLERQVFYLHYDMLMGRRIPHYQCGWSNFGHHHMMPDHLDT